jgi:hypothetical protein
MQIVGIAMQNTRSVIPNDGYRLAPRSQADIVQLIPSEDDTVSEVPPGWPSLLPETGER